MKIYMFEADWYCKPCGESIASTLPEPTEWEREHPDSNDYPVEYDSSEGESDTPDHCAGRINSLHENYCICSKFLERPLTQDGVEYVRELASEDIESGNELSETVQQWVEFYDIEVEVK
jgi:hypothetical protein